MLGSSTEDAVFDVVRQDYATPTNFEQAGARAKSLVDLLETKARQSAASTALVVGEATFTYAEVHARANRLARYLKLLGVGPDVLVGIALERSADLLVAVLATLKAGGAYVPLDPAYPNDRLAGMLEDANAPVLITQESLRAQLPAGPRVVLIDIDAAEIASFSDQPLKTVVAADSLAYVIYTSGSTGKPKGVAIEHHSVVDLIEWAADTYAADELAGVLFGTSVCFDLSVFEMFVPLALGGTIILADNVLQLPMLAARERVTLLNTVPSVAAELVRIQGLPESVRVVNLAGEALPDELATAIYALPTVAKLYNLYGPTEDTVYSTFALVERDQRVHLGQPLPNTRAYVLDGQGQKVGVGVEGELYLAGAGLARGYLNCAELTAERFVRDPFGPGRMYKTGDLCRWRPDGNLDYIGRIDHQVKIRGFRIELGEIESQLRSQAGVQQALVTAADNRLVAYVKADSTVTIAALREALKQLLPEHMMPAAFVLLDAFPLSPNGKIDRKRLPAPDFAVHSSSGELRNDTERRLAAIWREALGVAAVGRTDSFFDLGGHSLLAVRLIADVEKSFGRKLPLGSLFRSRTIEEMATILRDPGPTEDIPLLVRLRSGSGTPLFCVPGQGDFGFQFRELAEVVDLDAPIYTFSFERWERNLALFHTVEEMAAILVAEMRRVQPNGPYRLFGLCLGGWLVFEMARQLIATGERVETPILLESFGPPHIPLAGGSRLERLRLIWWHFRHLGWMAKARFLGRRLAAKLLPRRGAGLPVGEVLVESPGRRQSYFHGVYRPQAVAAKLHIIRAATQPEWYQRFGEDAPDLGWAGFGRHGISVSTVAGSRSDVLHGRGLQQVAAILRTALRPS
ncbi:MAG TPA: amino acid adenylation domain-containing protein [Gemmataceae bacterium]|nr:amino acid adenylation domain-containing protein [Gemmataceae bacterium]